MIVVRDIFQVEPEQMKLAKSLLKKQREIGQRLGHKLSRVLTDLTGDYYTLILEFEFDGLGEYEASLKRVLADPEFQKEYGKFRPLIRGGRREIFTVVVE